MNVHSSCSFFSAISDISYLKTVMPSTVDEEFFTFLRGIDGSQVTVSALCEGSLVFPRVPLMRLEGPLPGTDVANK